MLLLYVIEIPKNGNALERHETCVNKIFLKYFMRAKIFFFLYPIADFYDTKIIYLFSSIRVRIRIRIYVIINVIY